MYFTQPGIGGNRETGAADRLHIAKRARETRETEMDPYDRPGLGPGRGQPRRRDLFGSQRVAVARALTARPYPCSPTSQASLHLSAADAPIAELARSGRRCTMIVVGRDHPLLALMDRVLTLEDGCVVAE